MVTSGFTGERMADQGQVVVLTGWLDARVAGEVRQRLHTAVMSGSGPLVLEVSGVEAVDAVGLGVLVGTAHRAARQGRSVRLRGTNPRLRRLLTVTRLNRMLPTESGRARGAVARADTVPARTPALPGQPAIPTQRTADPSGVPVPCADRKHPKPMSTSAA